MGHFAGLDVSVKETSLCIVDDAGKILREDCERARGAAGEADEPRLPLQADWIGSWAAVAMAVQRSRRSGIAGDLCRDAAHESGIEGADQQDGSQRCARHGADDAGGALSSGACEDIA